MRPGIKPVIVSVTGTGIGPAPAEPPGDVTTPTLKNGVGAISKAHVEAKPFGSTAPATLRVVPLIPPAQLSEAVTTDGAGGGILGVVVFDPMLHVVVLQTLLM